MKSICVPDTQEAACRLDYNQTIDGDLTEIVLTNASFNKLFNSGFFCEINKLTNSNIDDFEDETIVDFNLLKAVLKSDIFKKHQQLPHVEEIRGLFVKALENGTGVFFYF